MFQRRLFLAGLVAMSLLIIAPIFLIGHSVPLVNASPVGTAIHSSLITHDASLLGAPVDTGWQVAIPNAKAVMANNLNPALATGTNSLSMSRSFQSAFSSFTIRVRYPSGGTLSTPPVVRPWGAKGPDYQSLHDADGNMEISLPSSSKDQDNGTWAWTESSAEVYGLGSSEAKLTLVTPAVCAAGAVQIEFSRN